MNLLLYRILNEHMICKNKNCFIFISTWNICFEYLLESPLSGVVGGLEGGGGAGGRENQKIYFSRFECISLYFSELAFRSYNTSNVRKRQWRNRRHRPINVAFKPALRISVAFTF